MMPDFLMINLVTAATVVTIALLLFMMITLFIMKHRQISRSRMYQQALVREQERTMQAISEEVHDDIGQHLYLARVKILLLHDALAAEYRGQMQELVEIVDQVLDSAHVISHALNSKSLKQRGLVASIEENIRLLNSARALNATLEVKGRPCLLEPDKELVIYRIYQEAMSNVMKHSKARQVWVDISYDEGQLALAVRDNGLGFLPDMPRQYVGIGLCNMQERAALLAGSLHIDSGPERGTLVRLRVPVKKRQEEAVPRADKSVAVLE